MGPATAYSRKYTTDNRLDGVLFNTVIRAPLFHLAQTLLNPDDFCEWFPFVEQAKHMSMWHEKHALSGDIWAFVRSPSMLVKPRDVCVHYDIMDCLTPLSEDIQTPMVIITATQVDGPPAESFYQATHSRPSIGHVPRADIRESGSILLIGESRKARALSTRFGGGQRGKPGPAGLRHGDAKCRQKNPQSDLYQVSVSR
eukprot:1941239-Rhodomonas_salina.1